MLRFDIGPDAIQVSLVTFSTHAYNEFFLNAYNNTVDLKRAIKNATYLGGTTHTYEALAFVKDNRQVISLSNTAYMNW